MVYFYPMDWGNDCQSDLENTKESVLYVSDKPCHTNKMKIQKREGIVEFAEQFITYLLESKNRFNAI